MFSVYLQPQSETLPEAVCPGQSLTYTCSYLNYEIEGNSLIDIEIGVSVTYPGRDPVGIVYDIDSALNVPLNVGLNTITNLLVRTQHFIQFLVTLTVPLSDSINGTLMQCSLSNPLPEDFNLRIRAHTIELTLPIKEGTYSLLSDHEFRARNQRFSFFFNSPNTTEQRFNHKPLSKPTLKILIHYHTHMDASTQAGING